MKKIITLIVLLTGIASMVSAADNVYLYGDNNSWNSSNTSYPFTSVRNDYGNVDGYHFRILINSEWVTNKSFYFRFKVDGTDWGVNNNDLEVKDTHQAATTTTDKALYIPAVSDACSKLVYIQIDYFDNVWKVLYYTRNAFEHVINFTKDRALSFTLHLLWHRFCYPMTAYSFVYQRFAIGTRPHQPIPNGMGWHMAVRYMFPPTEPSLIGRTLC